MNIRQVVSVSFLAVVLAVPCQVNADFGALLQNISSAVQGELANAVSGGITKKAQPSSSVISQPGVIQVETGMPQDVEKCEPANQLGTSEAGNGMTGKNAHQEESSVGLDSRLADSSPSRGESQADAQTVKVVAKGIGTTIDEAKKAAGRAAIEQVVGQLVDAETLVENDELVKDKILTYSGAYLEDVEVVGDPERPSDGLFSVKVLATVRKTQLAKKLEVERITKTKVSGGKLFANLASRQQEMADAEAMVAKEFEHFPHRFVKTELALNEDGSPALEVGAETGNVLAKVLLSVDDEAYSEWVKGLCLKLEKIATKVTEEVWTIGVDRQAQKCVGAFKDEVREMKRAMMTGERDDYGFELADCAERNSGNRKILAMHDSVCGTQSDEEFALAVVLPFRASSSAASVKIYHFQGDNYKKVRARLSRRIASALEVKANLMNGDEVLGMGTSLCKLRGSVMYLGSRHTNPKAEDYGCYIVAPMPWIKIYGMSNNNMILEYSVPKSCYVDLGAYKAEVLAEATEVKTQVAFYVPKEPYGNQLMSDE